MIENKKVTINNPALAALHGVAVGDTVPVACKNGVPTTKEWRNRFKDSVIDGCVTISQNDAKTSKSIKTNEGDK